MTKKRILLLSAYDTASHQYWRRALVTLFPEHDWAQLTLPPRHFNWRVRGNSLSWGFDPPAAITGNYDLVIATSLVDLASLRGFVPSLAAIPTLVYFHENQFAYPASAEQENRPYSSRLDAAMVSLYSALCADAVLFNSQFNRQSFLTGVEALLKRLPDSVPGGVLPRLTRSRVAPVPLLPEATTMARQRDAEVLTIAWNHRWEYDKGPALLKAVVDNVLRRDLPVRFHILGQQFREQPPEFDSIKVSLARASADRPDRQSTTGYIESREQYLSTLSRCDVVLSTAQHDFQGLAVLEACALGCTPLCPAHQAYPEYLEPQFLYPAPKTPADNQAAASSVADRLEGWLAVKTAGKDLPGYAPRAFAGETLRPVYQRVFQELMTPGKGAALLNRL